MSNDEIVQKFLDAKVEPSKYSIKNILGFSAQTLVRRGFTMSEIQRLYRELTREVKTCPCCSVQFTKLINTYCSSSCAAKMNNTKRLRTRKVAKEKTSKIIVKSNCICCGKILSKGQSKYCGYSCQQKYAQEDFIRRWLNGENVATVKGTTVSSRIRRYLFEKYRCKCSRCGWGEINPITGKTPLEVEHIDGDSKNNSPNNLTLLCPNCHSLTATYKALNKGNGRYERMQRYREGKSY